MIDLYILLIILGAGWIRFDYLMWDYNRRVKEEVLRLRCFWADLAIGRALDTETAEEWNLS